MTIKITAGALGHLTRVLTAHLGRKFVVGRTCSVIGLCQ